MIIIVINYDVKRWLLAVQLFRVGPHWNPSEVFSRLCNTSSDVYILTGWSNVSAVDQEEADCCCAAAYCVASTRSSCSTSATVTAGWPPQVRLQGEQYSAT